LVHSVRKGKSGLGDRIRGMLFATRLAVATKRVVLFTWKSEPDEPQAFFTPAGSIDWTLHGTGFETTLQDTAQDTSNTIQLDMYSWIKEQQKTLQEVKQGFLQTLDDVQYVVIHTNERAEAECAGCPVLDAPMRLQDSGGPAVANSAACLFHMLFKPRWVC
jgi:hypothetical protein